MPDLRWGMFPAATSCRVRPKRLPARGSAAAGLLGNPLSNE